MKAETYAQKQEILGPQVEKLEKLNEMMRPWLSEQKYDESESRFRTLRNKRVRNRDLHDMPHVTFRQAESHSSAAYASAGAAEASSSSATIRTSAEESF